jgi:4-amino-4-deoxy-L-arabinose transferase-like glycosyltransferase
MYSLKDEKINIKRIILIVSALFFLVCLFSIFKYGNSTLMGSLENPDNDDVKFIRSAWVLVETGNYVYHRPPSPTVFMMPGLAYTLAFFTLIIGKMPGLTAFRIFQAFIQTGSLMLVFFIGRKIFNSKIGLIAMIINAFYIAEIWVSNLIITETIFKFLVLNLVYISIYAIKENKTKYYALGGLLWGLATFFRPTIATYPIVILVMWILMKYKLEDIIKHTITVAVIFCVVLSPWWIRNYRIFNRFIPLTLASGNPMLQGTYLNYDQTSREKDGLDYSQFKYPADTEIANNEVEVAISKYRLKNLVPKQPIKFFLWYTIGKTIQQLNWPMYWNEILGVKFAIAGIYHYIILILGFIGIISFYRNQSRNKLGNILTAMLVYFIAVYLPFYAFSRYYYPAMPFAIIFAAERVFALLNRKNLLTD